MKKECGCKEDCACAENFQKSSDLKKHFEKDGSMFAKSVIMQEKTEIKNRFFELAEHEMEKGSHLIQASGVEKEDIIIYMPYYFNRMYCHYLRGKHINITAFISEFQGMKVIDGYENKIVISFKNAVFYNIDPIIIEIPHIENLT